MYKRIQTLKNQFNEIFIKTRAEILKKKDLQTNDLESAFKEYHAKLIVAIDRVYENELSKETRLAVTDLSKSVTKVNQEFLKYKRRS